MLLPPGSQLVFEQFVTSGTGSQYGTFLKSDPRFNEWLGRSNDLSLFAVVDRADGVAFLLGLVEEGADEEAAWWPGSEQSSAIVGMLASSGETLLSGLYTEQNNYSRPHLAYRRLSVAMTASGATPVTARVRIWAAGRAGSRRFHQLILRQRIEGTDPIYTPEIVAECLLEVDKVVPSVLTEDVAGTNPVLNVQAEESANGIVWTNVQTSPEISLAMTSGAVGVPAIGIGLPSSDRVRYRLQLSGASPAATVRLWVTGRDVFPR